MAIPKEITDKLLSGRFLFTIAVGVVFVALSIKGTLPPDKIMEVTLVVLYAYFTRGDRKQNGGETK